MKKLMKTLLCLVLAASLCFGMGLVTFADEASDVSLDDLLALLQQLAGDSGDETGGGEEAGDADLYTIAGMSFAVPEGLTYMDDLADEETAVFMADDMSAYLQATFFEAMEGENIDLTDDLNREILMASMQEEGTEILSYDLIEVAGHNALRFNMTSAEADDGYIGYCLVLQLDNGLAPIQYITMDGTGEETFQAIIDSIVIDSAAQAGTPAPAGDPVPAAAEEIDATLVDEVVLVDNDVCKVAFKKFSTEEDYYGFACKVYLENKSDVNLYFTTDYEAINDYMCSGYLMETVSAGHKTNTDMHFYQSDLDENGITDIRSLSFKLTVRNDDDYFADPYVEQTFTILPFGADVPVQPEKTFDDDAITLIDTDEFKMILTGFDDTNSYYFIANVYLENNSDQFVLFKLDSSSTINGYELNPYFYEYIPAGKKANAKIEWSWDDLENNDIDTLEDMELALIVQDYEDYWGDPLYQDTVYLTFE